MLHTLREPPRGGESDGYASSFGTNGQPSPCSWPSLSTTRPQGDRTRPGAGEARVVPHGQVPGAPLPQGGRPAPLSEVAGWQDRVKRHVMEDLGTVCPYVQILDLPVPQVVRTLRTPCGSWTSRLPCRLLKYPRSLARRVLLVLLFLSRSQRNSWWKCRPCCLPRASLFRSRSRSSSLQFLVVVAMGVFKVFFQDRVQQRRLVRRNVFLSGLRSSSWTLLLVWALDRDLPHLLVLQMRILLGGFRTFPPN